MKRLTTFIAAVLVACTPNVNPEEDNTQPSDNPETPVTPVTPQEPEDTGVCVDAPLVLDLDSAPVLGSAGVIAVYTSDGKEVDRIDLADLSTVDLREDGTMVPKAQITADSKFNTFMDALKSGSRYRAVHYTPLRIKGNSLIIKLHDSVLSFGSEYYVSIDAGAVEGHNGVAAGEWTFKTKARTSSQTLKVNPDGSGDFCTLQGALGYASTLGKDTAVTIEAAAGTYNEMLFLRDKNNVTVKGASGTIISYPNNEGWCSGSGGSRTSRPAAGASVNTSGGRVLMLVENCDNLTLSDLTIENSFGQLKGQAETIYFNSGSNSHKLIIGNCSLLSYQDTFLCKGEVWVHDSLIAGHCDFVWGYPKACLFENCEIRARAAGYIVQARVKNATDKGFVFLNCRLTAEDGVGNGSMYLARSGGDASVYDNVTFVNCEMSPAIASQGWYSKPSPNPAVPTAVSGWKEYGSKDAAGKTVAGHNALGRVLTSTEAEGFSSRQAVLGW